MGQFVFLQLTELKPPIFAFKGGNTEVYMLTIVKLALLKVFLDPSLESDSVTALLAPEASRCT